MWDNKHESCTSEGEAKSSAEGAAEVKSIKCLKLFYAHKRHICPL